MNASVSTTVRFDPRVDGDKAGLVAMQSDDFYWFVGLARAGGQTVVRVEKRTGKGDPVDGVVVGSGWQALAVSVDINPVGAAP